jgi:rod shape determining protein RodA
MILISVALVIFFIARVSVWYFFTGFFGLLFLLPFVWRNLHDYQKKRVLMFLNPESDPLGAGYNIIQSKIAIGSGGFFGKGYLAGTQSHLDFLPEHQTDFVFPMFAEEFGFIGSSILIIFYAFICFYSIKIANNSRSFFGKYLTMGLITIFTLHVIVNIGMVTGVLPVVGIPLPFFSYGGTVTASSMIAFSLILNVFASSKNKMPSPI